MTPGSARWPRFVAHLDTLYIYVLALDALLVAASASAAAGNAAATNTSYYEVTLPL